MKKKNILAIILYGIILTFLLVGIDNLYGSNIDWINQHTIIPQYFRSLFYETKSLLPNFAFNIGAGQNIFNFSYYGLLSPIILFSYIFPFIPIPIYIMIISFILYILSGILMYIFLYKNHFKDKISLLLSLCFISFAPITFHFHHHIMFVWYMPFLLMGLLGVDKYINKNKSLLLMISVFLIIMTNYYYSIVSILVIIIYGIYKLLHKYTEFSFKTFFKDLLKASLRIIIPILMASIILLPTLYVIINSKRNNILEISYLNLVIPNLKEIFYSSFTAGISMIFLVGCIQLVLKKKAKKDEMFLGICLLLITLFPIFIYVLNGFLYLRGKILIPFIPLYIFALAKFIEDLKNNRVNLKILFLVSLIIIVLSLFSNYLQYFIILLILDFIITFLSLRCYKKFKNIYFIFIPLFIILLSSSLINNFQEKYVKNSDYEKISHYNISKLLDNINDSSFYRMDNYNNVYVFMNQSFRNNYYSSSIYSSNYNNYYHDFYFFKSGNNIVYRNNLMTAGAKNILFNNLMGIKYIISDKNLDNIYEKIASQNSHNLYYNKNAYPLFYVANNLGSSKTYENLDFPYNMEYMLSNPVIENNKEKIYNSKIELLDLGLESSYNFKLDKNKVIEYKLPQAINDKNLIITFTMDYNETCANGDTTISINGIKNKLTCQEWLYHNKNKSFEYVIPAQKNLTKLNIKISKGKYKISNLKVYLLENKFPKYNALNNININKNKSIITADVKVNKDAYVISSIPYDQGFKIYVNDKQIKLEKVNTAFIGFKIKKGANKIKIIYKSPWLNYGKIISIEGLIIFICISIYEKKKIN